MLNLLSESLNANVCISNNLHKGIVCYYKKQQINVKVK
jgi:hypothetical protein